MYDIKLCPVCQNSQFVDVFKCKDYTQSQEWFQLIQCNHCLFTITSPRPDEQDLGKYYQSTNYISHSDTSEGLINKLYKVVRNYTLFLKIKWIQKLITKGKLIDIGSGAGYFLNSCKLAGYDVIGIEPDQEARAQTLNRFKAVCHPESYLEEIKTEEADLITMWHVLEHVPDPVLRLKQIHRILKSKGYVVIAVPNRSSYDAKHYQSYWAGYDVPRHLWHFSPENIIQLVVQNGFECVQIKPMIFDAFYVSMLSESYMGNALAFIRGMMIGIISNLYAFFSKRNAYSSQVYVFRKAQVTSTQQDITH